MGGRASELDLSGLRRAQGRLRVDRILTALAGSIRPSKMCPAGEAMRILHTMLRVGDLGRSTRFYTEVLGMKVLRTTDRPEQKYTLAFVGYGEESDHAVLELTYNYGVDRYDLGSAFGHVAIEVPDVAAACESVRAAAKEFGGKVTREAGPVKGGTSVIAFVEDPDGYKIELIERKSS